jgi:hypothetical protein
MSVSSFKRKKYIFGGIIIIAAAAIAVGIVFFALQERPHNNVLSLPDIAAPGGWYAHPISNTNLIFTRDKILPTIGATEGYAYGEQIDVDIATTTLSPDDYVANEGLTGQLAEVFGASSSWSILENHRIFITEFAGEADKTMDKILFSSGTVYEFMLYPDNAKDYGDFQKIIDEVSGELR